LTDELLGGTRLFGVHFVGNAQSNLLIGVFILTFLVSALSMAAPVFRGETPEDSQQRPLKQRTKSARQAQTAKQKAREKVAPAETMAPAEKDLVAGPDAAADPSAKILNEASLSPSTEALASVDQAVKADEGSGTSQQASEVKEDVGQDINEKPDPASEQPKRAVVLDAETHGEAPQVETMTPAEEKQKAFMLGFLGKSLEGSQTDQKKMDNFNKFGVNLYIAGACEILSQKRNLDVRTSSKILADAVQGIGFKKSHAASFADRYEEYLMADSRYMQMFQAGRNAMNIHLTDESAAPKLMDSALEDWNKPKERQEQTGPITVLFTDIAGSTAMTQALGDEGAQQVVRAHNRIVREALSSSAGKEVKHTGDGIMASFARTSDGVDAAIEMQIVTMMHNQQNPSIINKIRTCPCT
jgi:adenylate cyclase